MRLRVMLPSHVGFEGEVDAVVAEGSEGFFGLLPRHVDTVSELVPGLLSYSQAGSESYLAVDGGMLVKVGDEVLVITTTAVGGAPLEDLRMVVEDSLDRLEHRELAARNALARLETDIVQRMVEMQERSRG